MKKPNIKSQKEISNDLVKPYSKQYGNPNNIPDNPNEGITGIKHNRGRENTWIDKENKPVELGFQGIDESIFYYIENNIQPRIVQNNDSIKVPVIYSTPERWSSYRSNGYFRDKKGGLMLPVIVLKRENITKVRNITSKLDANSPNLHYIYQKQYNRRNSYNSFDAMNGIKPEVEYYGVVMPEYVKISYRCYIQTYYSSQLNHLIEAFTYASDSYWGELNKFKFMCKIDQFSMETDISSDTDRFVKGSFDINLNGYIIPDVLQKDMNTNPIFYSRSKFTIDEEATEKL